ncbi:hypothetical protein C5S39_15220 [Candidatus Methanophagaceae archaeon]|jgi:hypothetical protein|nr:hypothetical protein C5S39_15220 [Methanophagales archaeon]
MQEEYTGRLLDDGHLYIPKEIIDKLKIHKGSRLRVSVKVEGKAKKEKILAYAGLFSDLTEEEQRRFDESIKRRSFFGERKVKI